MTSPLDPIFIDLETRSSADLRIDGGRRYAVHRSTQLLSAVALIDDLAVVWVPLWCRDIEDRSLRPTGFPADCRIRFFYGREIPLLLATAIAERRPLCAHNAGDFDEHVWRAQRLPEPSAWIDTLPMVRAAGMPGKLDLLGMRLLGRGKDTEGAAVLKSLMSPNMQGHFAPLTESKAAALARYNLADVFLLREVYRRYSCCGEQDVIALDRVINDRGITFDQDLAKAIMRLNDQLRRAAGDRVTAATDRAVNANDLQRTQFLKGWLNSAGIPIPNLRQATVIQYLKNRELSDNVVATLEARLACNNSSMNKLQRALERVDDDSRLRHLLVYHRALTGRWAGRVVQPQNLPRPKKELGDINRLVGAVSDLKVFRAAVGEDVSLRDALAALIRPCIRAAPGKRLIIADFAAIEARGVAWFAEEQELLSSFRAGDDVYAAFATNLFGRPITKSRNEQERTVGKTAVLSCGYGVGPLRFGEQCATDGVDLNAVGLTPQMVVEGYRNQYPCIAGRKVQADGFAYRSGGLWKDLEHAAMEAIGLGRSSFAGRCDFEFDARDGTATVWLPSGRPLYYREARIIEKVPTFAGAEGRSERPRPQLTYTGATGKETNLYGGKITENVVSGTCRDLLVSAMLQLEQAGLPIVMHVHDEIICEVPVEEAGTALTRVLEIMTRVPAWAEGFPIEAEGFISERYVKSPPCGALAAKARNGRIIT